MTATFSKRVVLETRDAERALQRIDREALKARLGMKSMESQAQKAMDTIGLRAEEQIPRLQRLNNAVQGFTGKIGSGIKAIDQFGKSLGPWNQTLELAGKAVRFVDNTLEAYSKTSAQAAEDVKKLRGEFSQLRDDFMAGAGRIAVEILKPAASFDELRKKMIQVENTDLYQRMFMKRGEAFGDFFGDDETKDPINALGEAWGGVKDSLKGTIDYWNTSGTTFVDSVTDGMKRNAAAAKSAADENARWVKAFREGQEGYGRGRYNIEKPDFGSPYSKKSIDTSGNDQINRAFEEIEANRRRMEEQASREARYGESATRRNETFLESTFGPVGEFDVYRSAFEGLTGAVSGAYGAWIDGSMSAGQAFKKFISEAIASLGKQMAIEALKEGAYAIASLAMRDFDGAAKHGAAAAAFLGGSVAAGVAAKALGGSGSSGGGAAPAGGGGSSGGGSRGGGSGGSGGGESQRPLVVVLGNHFDELSPRQRSLMAERQLKKVLGGDGGEDN